MTEIQAVIPEKHIIILSPHYDDVPLTFGGYLMRMAGEGFLKKHRIRIVNIFSRSNYLARDDKGNSDTSVGRTQYATGIRLLEDLTCLDGILGFGNYSYEIKAERECVLRQKEWKPGEKFEFPQGNQSTFDEEDRQIFNRIKKYAQAWLVQSDTALLVPLGVKEHIDHVMVRDAVMEVKEELNPIKAAIYFGEDQPYTGLASKEDWQVAEQFIQKNALHAVDYQIDAQQKADLIKRNYPTQVESSYLEGILNRADQLKESVHVACDLERIYQLTSLTQG
jgi:hypothetical protein